MKKCLSVLAAIVFCALGLASTSDAQMMRGGGPPQFAGVFNPKVGVGAAYEIQKQDGNKTMEMAVVGKETVDGKDAYWWEMAMPDEKMGGEMVFKTLLVMDGENTHASKMIMQLPGKPPMEMPAGMGRGDHSRVPTDVRETTPKILAANRSPFPLALLLPNTTAPKTAPQTLGWQKTPAPTAS